MNTTVLPSLPVLKALTSILSRPFPLETDAAKRVLISALFGIGVALVLLVFEPFGLSGYQSAWKTLLVGFYGVITFVGMIVSFFVLERVFPHFFDEERWNVGKHIALTLWNITFIGVLNYVYSCIVFSFGLHWKPLLFFILWSFAVGLVPVIIWTLVLERRYWKKNVAAAAEISSSIAQQREEHHQEHIKQQRQVLHNADAQAVVPQRIVLTGTSTKEQYELNISSILCIQAHDNYVTLFYESSETVKKILFRATLKSLEEQLTQHSNFFRCHKSYIVNSSLIQKVSGNAQGYKLHLPWLDFVIPVSRSLQQELLGKLHHLDLA